MKRAAELEALRAVSRPVVLAVGFLDGVHLGHRRVIETAREQAAARGGEAWVLTFEPHPLKVLRPDRAPPLITGAAEKLALIEALGVDGTIVLPFTRRLAEVEPEEFVRRLAAAAPTLAGLAVGENWRFGHGARGDVTLLERLAAEAGVGVTIVPPVRWQGEPVSSTRVREAVGAGRMAEAEGLLGRPFRATGPVVAGRAIGRELGFPTANVAMENELEPPPGVYAAEVDLDGAVHAAGAYIGARPTFGHEGDTVLEVYLLDWRGDLYGRRLAVRFHRRIRGDQRFDSPEALRAQIAADLAAVRQSLAEAPWHPQEGARRTGVSRARADGASTEFDPNR